MFPVDFIRFGSFFDVDFDLLFCLTGPISEILRVSSSFLNSLLEGFNKFSLIAFRFHNNDNLITLNVVPLHISFDYFNLVLGLFF